MNGQAPSGEDNTTFNSLNGKGLVPSASENPNTFAWYNLVKKFSEPVRNTWTGAGA